MSVVHILIMSESVEKSWQGSADSNSREEELEEKEDVVPDLTEEEEEKKNVEDRKSYYKR